MIHEAILPTKTIPGKPSKWIKGILRNASRLVIQFGLGTIKKPGRSEILVPTPRVNCEGVICQSIHIYTKGVFSLCQGKKETNINFNISWNTPGKVIRPCLPRVVQLYVMKLFIKSPSFPLCWHFYKVTIDCERESVPGSRKEKGGNFSIRLDPRRLKHLPWWRMCLVLWLGCLQRRRIIFASLGSSQTPLLPCCSCKLCLVQRKLLLALAGTRCATPNSGDAEEIEETEGRDEWLPCYLRQLRKHNGENLVNIGSIRLCFS